MTAYPEMRYLCDRCACEVTAPIQNTPVHARSAGAEGWMALVIGTEQNTPVTHLCDVCATVFANFMKQIQ
jgi:hypothetical protein